MITGYVKKTNTKEGTGKRGKWVLYSAIIELDNGTESGWISCGFEKPPFAEGSYGSLDTSADGKYTNYVVGSWKPLDPPAKPQPAASSGLMPVSSPGGSYPSRDAAIQYQSSRKDALQLVGLMLEHDALPISTAAAKASVAKRFEEIKAFVDKLTVEFYGDVQTGRVLLEVVDAGAEQAMIASGQTHSESTPDND